MLFRSAHGIAEVMVPRTVVVTPSLPVLATGKIDYAGALALVEQQLEAQQTSRPEIPARAP